MQTEVYEPVPHGLDALRVRASEHGREVMLDDGEDGAAALAAGVGVPKDQLINSFELRIH